MDGDSFVTRIPRMNYAAGLFLFLDCLVTTSLTAAENESPVAQPNILWISAEDISAGTLGCYGGDSYTPTIDALAAVGIRYDAAFAAAPVCA
ncbi:MAG: sulfatase-like hydrolase/transferase, partial [Pirellulales bacterium]|nr:sulfatase-like hydrolase/transferase [Pirellulales bacterium]